MIPNPETEGADRDAEIDIEKEDAEFDREMEELEMSR